MSNLKKPFLIKTTKLRNNLIILFFAMPFLFFSCTNNFMGGDEGIIIINFGGRSSHPWPPDDPDNYILDKIVYKVTLSSNSVDITFDVTGGTNIKRTVPVGFYNVEIEAYYERQLYATGSCTVDVKAGQNATASITMYRADPGDPKDPVDPEDPYDPEDPVDPIIPELPEIKTIALTHTPDKTLYYLGEDFNITGLAVIAIYSDGSTLAIDNSSLKFSGFDNSTTATMRTITVMYNGFTTQFNIQVINTFTVANSAQWNEAKAILAKVNGGYSYIINLTSSISVPGSTDNTFGDADLTVTINGGTTAVYSINLTSQGSLLNIGAKQDITISDLKLNGMGIDTPNYNNAALANVENGGTFTMKGFSEITGNNSSNSGGGVSVQYGSTFTMEGYAAIHGNAAANGGGVFVNSGATFKLLGGTVLGDEDDNIYDHNSCSNEGAALMVINGGIAEHGSIKQSFLTDGVGSYGISHTITKNGVVFKHDLGTPGPGGGTIIYLGTFIVEGYGNEGDAGYFPTYTAHYLEAAPGNWNNPITTGDPELAWASTTAMSLDVKDTGYNIGSGRRNTAIIIATDSTAPAAMACENYFTSNATDWFLPSVYEIVQLCNEVTFSFTTGYIWTSSQISPANVQAIYYENGKNHVYSGSFMSAIKSTPYYVRPIRAF